MYKQNCIYHDPSGNGDTYIAGATYLNGNYDIIVTKIDVDGAIIWSKTYGGAGDDAASKVFLDVNSNVYVCGTKFIDSTNFNDFVLLKYLPNGTLDWDVTYNGDGSLHDGAIDMVYDSQNNLIVVTGTGFNSNSDLDFITLQYDDAGNLQWDSYFDVYNNNDVAARVLTDGNSIYVTGAGMYQQWDWRATIVEYDNAGNYVNHDIVATGSITADIIGDFFRDTIGNIYITGSRNDTNSYNYFTVKYDTLLSTQWNNTYDAPHGGNDYATGIWVDYDGNVYVTGAATDTINGYDIHTLKYNSSGSLVWTKTWNDATYNGNDSAVAIIGDTLGNLYIIAGSTRAENRDYLILKYDTAGNELWNITYNGLDNGDDIPTAVAIEPSTKDIYVTGTVEEATRLTYITLRLKEIDVILPQDTSDVPDAWNYTVNLGQLLNTDTLVETSVIYYTKESYPAMFFKNGSFSYLWTKWGNKDTTSATNDSLHRVDMTFETENITKPRGYNKKNFYSNYYLGDMSENREKIPHYGNLLYTNVWNYIDIECGSDAYGFKYFINVKPNGDTSDIQFLFSGQDTLLIDGNGNLLIVTDFDTLVQPKPAAWEIDNSGTKTNLGWSASYNITGNIVSLTMGGSYTPTKTLILAVGWEPFPPASIASTGNLEWSTYYGGSDKDYFYDIESNSANDIFVTGITYSANFPVTNGSSLSSSTTPDVVVLKFNNSGVRTWATYLGGGKFDGDFAKHGIEVNSLGEIFVAFRTESQNIPLLNIGGSSYFDNTNNCNSSVSCPDIYIGRFNSSGNLTYGSYFGGYGTISRLGDIKIDGNDNLYVTGQEENIPIVTPSGAYYSANGGAIIAEFNKNMVLLWSTYYGVSNGAELGKEISIDNQNNVFITGVTRAVSGFPLVDPGSGAYYQSTFGGGNSDAFICEFNSSNSLVWSSYFGGNNDDYGYSLIHDNQGNLIMTGWTESTSSFPLLNFGGSSYYQATNQGSGSYFAIFFGDAFITKFDSQRNIVASTLYGKSANEGGADLAIDVYDNIYCVMATASDMLPFPSSNPTNAYQQTSHSDGNDVNDDAFINTLSSSFELKWGTYFGSTGTNGYGRDIPYATCITQNSKLYIIGTTASLSNFPLEDPGSGAYYQQTNPSVSGFISRFDLPQLLLQVNNNNSIKPLNINVYPNPCKDKFYLFLPKLEQKEGVNVKLIDIVGRNIVEQNLQHELANTYQFETNNLSNGIYMVKVTIGSNVYSSKIIVE